jgi:hypothetical protein
MVEEEEEEEEEEKEEEENDTRAQHYKGGLSYVPPKDKERYSSLRVLAVSGSEASPMLHEMQVQEGERD